MNAPDLRRIVDVAPLVRSGAISPVDLVRGCLSQIDARASVNAFITRMDASSTRLSTRKLRFVLATIEARCTAYRYQSRI